jgi:hypothetical protein
MTVVGRLWRYCAALARELADENGYARHLKQTGRAHSAAEWKLFIDRRLARKYQNAKCC